MKIKFYIIAIFILNISLNQPYAVFASTVNKETNNSNISTFYVSDREENKTVISIINALKLTEAIIVYSGDMYDSNIDYLQEVINCNCNYPSKDVNNSSYGISSFFSCSLTNISESNDSITVKLFFTYYESNEQTKEVKDTIRKAIKENVTDLTTDYNKAYWAYHWIIDKVHYDKTLVNHSAYAGLQETGTVCQGYAALYCYIANELGLDCGYIAGTVGYDGKAEHAWNVIKINGLWYCVDPTWGDSIYGDKFFLKSKETFGLSEYKFHKSNMYKNYIDSCEYFATTDYDINEISNVNHIMPSVYNIEMNVFKNSTITRREKYSFMLSNKDNIPIYFKSEDPSIAKVNKNGLVTGVNEGVTTIIAYNDNLNFSQKCVITVKTNDLGIYAQNK